jgi:hypothetical protein
MLTRTLLHPHIEKPTCAHTGSPYTISGLGFVLPVQPLEQLFTAEQFIRAPLR